MKALVLNEAEVEKISHKLTALTLDLEACGLKSEAEEWKELLKLLTAPRTEALGLSKEEWEHWSSYIKVEFAHEEHEAAVAMDAIASSLQEIPVDGITGFPLRPANENDLEEGNQIASSLSDKGEG